MNRIMSVGERGSGKRTLDRGVGARTELPVMHIDKIH
jgi:shikimate kinase